MKKTLSESILIELDRKNIMSNIDVQDIINSFSSRMNHLKYKIEGNQAIFEDGTIIKFIVNDDSEIEYYFINKQGDASKAVPVYDTSLIDMLTESDDLNSQFRGKAQEAADLFDKAMNDRIIKAHQQSMAEIARSIVYQMINAASYGFSDEDANKLVDNILNYLK